MTPADVVARIRAAGGRMLEGPRLWLPRTCQGPERSLILLGIEKFKAEVVALLPPEPIVFCQPVLTLAEKCSRCGKLVFAYDGDLDGIYESCRLTGGGNLACPYVRADHPALNYSDRRWRQWEAKKLSEAVKRESEPIPE